MKILILSSSDGRGGAFAAAYRLQVGLNQAGIKSKMLVRDKTRNDDNVIKYKSIVFDWWRNLGRKLTKYPFFFTQEDKSIISLRQQLFQKE